MMYSREINTYWPDTPVPEFQPPIVGRGSIFSRLGKRKQPSPEPEDRYALPGLPNDWQPDNISVTEKRRQVIEIAKKIPGFPDPAILEYYHTPEEIVQIKAHEKYMLDLTEIQQGIAAVERHTGKKIGELTIDERVAAQNALCIDRFTGKRLPVIASTTGGGGGVGGTSSQTGMDSSTSTGLQAVQIPTGLDQRNLELGTHKKPPAMRTPPVPQSTHKAKATATEPQPTSICSRSELANLNVGIKKRPSIATPAESQHSARLSTQVDALEQTTPLFDDLSSEGQEETMLRQKQAIGLGIYGLEDPVSSSVDDYSPTEPGGRASMAGHALGTPVEPRRSKRGVSALTLQSAMSPRKRRAVRR
jgi:hypothetical protein